MKSLILLSILLVCVIAKDTKDPELAELYKIEYLKEGDGVHFPNQG